MNNTKILRAIGGVDDDLIERASQKNTVRRSAFAPWLKWAMPVAACFVIATAIALPMILNNPAFNHDSQTPGGGGVAGGVVPDGDNVAGLMPGGTYIGDGQLLTLDDIFGLPTRSSTWDEGDGVELSRMPMLELRHLMREFDSYDPDVKAAFAIVRVVSAERFTAAEEWLSESQIAVCEVLYEYLGDYIDMQVSVKQYLYGGCIGDEETNLIRVGGVYVLPLINWQNEDFWTVYGDLDCLFEVDDRGLIESHSRNEQLNKYNGRLLAELWKDIGYLYMNPILRSRLAEYVGGDFGVHHDIVVQGSKIALHSILLDGSEWYGWEEGDTGRFDADIGADGRITIATDGFNVFRPVEGMTIEEMEETVLQIKRFLKDGTPIERFEAAPGISDPPATPIDGTDYSSAVAVKSPEECGKISDRMIR